MSCYITQDMVLHTLGRIKSCHRKIVDVMDSYGIDVESESGRANCFMSLPQEKFVEEALHIAGYVDAKRDGRPGKSDIVIPSIDRKLECKVTTQGSGLKPTLQADFWSFRKEEVVDHLYYITDVKRQKFCVFFCPMTIDAFRSSSNLESSRGRVHARRSYIYENATVLHGQVVPNAYRFLIARRETLLRKLTPLRETEGIITSERMKLLRKLEEVDSRIRDFDLKAPSKGYSFILEP